VGITLYADKLAKISTGSLLQKKLQKDKQGKPSGVDFAERERMIEEIEESNS